MFLNETDTNIYLALQTVFDCLLWYRTSTIVNELHLSEDISKNIAYILNKDINSKIEENHHGWLITAMMQIWSKKVYDPILLRPEEKKAIMVAVEAIKVDPVIIVPRMIRVLEFAWNNTKWADSVCYAPQPWQPDDRTPPRPRYNYEHFIEVLKTLVM